MKRALARRAQCFWIAEEARNPGRSSKSRRFFPGFLPSLETKALAQFASPYSLALALSVLLAACGSPPPPVHPLAKPAAPLAAKVATPDGVEAPPPEEVYSYSAIGKRDPFRSPLDDLIISNGSAAQCPLCKWEIDQLKLVAVVTGTGNPVAIVEDPRAGRSPSVRLGHADRQAQRQGEHDSPG